MTSYSSKRQAEGTQQDNGSPLKIRRSSRLEMRRNGDSSTSLRTANTNPQNGTPVGTISNQTNTPGKVTITPSYPNFNPFQRSAGFGRGGPAAMMLGGVPLNDLQLGVDPSLSKETWDRITAALEAELIRQAENPPVLPETRVKDLAPKARKIALDSSAPGEDQDTVEQRNNHISENNKTQDRQRNNMAAKKSRELRIEAVRESRRLLNEKEAECAWYRLYILASGGSVDGWDCMDPDVKQNIVDEVAERVTEVDEARKEEAKVLQRAGRIALHVIGSLEQRERGQDLHADDERLLKKYEAEIQKHQAAKLRRNLGQQPFDGDDQIIDNFELHLQQVYMREVSMEREVVAREARTRKRPSAAVRPMPSPTKTAHNRMAIVEVEENQTIARPETWTDGNATSNLQTGGQASFQSIWNPAMTDTAQAMPYPSMSGSGMPTANVPIAGCYAGDMSLCSGALEPPMGLQDLSIEQPGSNMPSNPHMHDTFPGMAGNGVSSGSGGTTGMLGSSGTGSNLQSTQSTAAMPNSHSWMQTPSHLGTSGDCIDPGLMRVDPDLPSLAFDGHNELLPGFDGLDGWGPSLAENANSGYFLRSRSNLM